jgi:polyhydroxyalkanoate synthesis regulator phasin
MARKKKAATKRAKRAPRTQGVLQDTWRATLDGLASAETEVQKQLRSFVRRNRMRVEDASELLDGLQRRFDKQRKQTTRELESRFKALQSRVKKERHALSKMANDAVQSALASFNIPSRREVAELTRKVEELSRKIDSLRRR